MMVFDPHDPKYWDAQDLQQEFTRILDVCNGCRLCDGLCPPFVDVFDRIDQEDDKQTAAGIGHENPVLQLKQADYDHVVDYCYQCKLCYPKCPYTPPHEYMLDFPRLLLRADAVRVKEKGKSLKEKLRDEVIGDTDRLGKIGSAMPGLMNFSGDFKPARVMMEKTVGIHRDKKLPTYFKPTFRNWYDERDPVKVEQPLDKVALFYTCQLNNNKPWIGRQYVEILEKNNILVIAPEQECCGMPELGTGNIERVVETADRNVRRLLPVVNEGFKIIAMSPSCSLMLRQEYLHYATNKEAAKKIQEAILDPIEYLMQMYKKKAITFEFPVNAGEKFTYHLPCHLRVQNIGFHSRDLLKLLPNVKVTMVQQCSGHDGAWSMKKEYYQISLDVGKKLFKGIEKEKPATVVSDCALAHLHIEEGTDEQALHPIEVLYRALGYTQHLQKPKN